MRGTLRSAAPPVFVGIVMALLKDRIERESKKCCVEPNTNMGEVFRIDATAEGHQDGKVV